MTKQISLRNLTVRLLTVLLLTAHAGISSGKESHIRYSIIGQTDGLASNKVTSIAKDSLGTIWIGTRKGLDRICEKKIIHYGNPPELGNKEILFVTADRDGGIWAGLEEGLYQYDSSADSFKIINTGGLRLHPVSFDTISDGIVFNTWEGFAEYRYETGEMKLILPREDRSKRYRHFLIADDSTAIVASNYEGIYRLNLNSGHRKCIFPLSADDYVNCIDMDSEGRIWFAIYNSGLTCISADTGKILAHFPQNGKMLDRNIVLGIQQKDSMMFVITDGGGILTVDMNDFSTSDIENYLQNPMPLQADAATSMLMTGDEIWIGTIHHGVIVLKYGPIRHFTDIDFGFDRTKAANGSVIACLAEDMQGRIWIGSDGAGISIFDPHSGTCTPYEGLEKGKVVSIVEIDDRRMLASVYGKGLFICSKDGGSISHLPIADPETNSRIMRQDIVIKLKRHDDGNILISARDMYFYNPETGDFRYAKISGQSNCRIPYSDSVQTYLYNLSEVFRLDNASGKCARLMHSAENDIIQMRLVKDDLWLIKSGKLVRMNTGKSIPKEMPFHYNGQLTSMETDLEGNLWLTTGDRLIKLNGTDTENYIVFDDADGFYPNEFSPDATMVSSTGDMYFGGYSGLYTVMTGAMPESDAGRSLALLSASVDGQNIDSGITADNGHPLVTVPWNYSSLDFSICIDGGYALQSHRYRYTINNRGKHTVIESNNHLSLPVLAPGTYKIDIAYADRSDKWIEHDDAMIIQVTPPKGRVFILPCLFILLSGTVIFAVWLYHRREKVKAARVYRRRKEKLAENKVRFLINISHELRTPLTLIYAPLKRLMDKTSGPPELKSELSGILSQTKYMIQLINMTLDARKLEEGYGKLNLQSHDLNRWTSGVVDEFKAEYESKDISVTFEPDPAISSVCYDEGKFHIILTNLLMNAWKYSEPHTTVTVKTATMPGNRIRISVTDQGIGLKGVDTDAIFGRFVQAHGQSKGFGLGLAYTKQLVEAHPGGNIGAHQNEDGKGSTFWFEIPSDIPADTAEINGSPIMEGMADAGAEIPLPADSGNDGDINLSAYTILIAEDEPDLLRFLKKELESVFRKVITAPDGNEAYEKAVKFQPDIIVSDVMMPKMNGYELCRKVKNDISISHIPVILLTALAEQSHRSAGYKSGADIFLAKPFDITTLLSAVRNLIRSREQTREKYRRASGSIPVSEITFSNADEQFMLKLDKFITDNISNDALSAQMIIDHLCMGRASFYKKMKEVTGQGIMEYVTAKRMAFADELLKNTSMSISEIAFKTGYSDNQYFSRVFKQHFGISPSSFRKANVK